MGSFDKNKVIKKGQLFFTGRFLLQLAKVLLLGSLSFTHTTHIDPYFSQSMSSLLHAILSHHNSLPSLCLPPPLFLIRK